MAANVFALAKGRGFVAGLPGAYDKLKTEIVNWIESLLRYGPAQTKDDSDLQPMLQCPALTFANALLAAVIS